MRLFCVIFSIFLVFCCSIASNLPWCSPEQACMGRWIETKSLINATENLLNFEKYYHGPSCKKALVFSQAWVPSSECMIFRFTASHLRRAVKARVEEVKLPKKPGVQTTDGIQRITWMFFGDSALRGIFCGIVRILEGSESDGPCRNRICGGIDVEDYRGPNPPKRKPGDTPLILGAVSYLALNKLFEISYFDTQLVLQFVYVKSFNTDPKVPEILLQSAKRLKKGDTIIHNSGAWDFDEYARQRKQNGEVSIPPEDCQDDITREIGRNRSSDATIKAMWDISQAANKTGVQLIYRNNHYNERFGPVCADAQLEAAIRGSNWQIFNNRDISRDVWRKQCPDGFHFARDNIYSVEDHRKYAEERFKLDGVYPGQLEMQLAQSLLYHIFYGKNGFVFSK